jgi:DNA-binding beta-propeller fold protein YncE
MKKTLTAILVCLFISTTQIKAQRVIDSLVGPESVLKVGDKLLVSNMRGGFISELSADGKFIRKNFSKTVLHAPKGLAAINNTIYVTDTSRVVGFDIHSGEPVFELVIPEATFLNDLCTAGQNRLAVSDSKSDEIYLINISSKTIQFLGSIPGANGVTYNEKTKQLFTCGVGPQWNGQGKLYVKNLAKQDTPFTELRNSPTGFFDGIELMNDDHLIVDDGSHGGRLFIYDLKKHSSISYALNYGAADLYYDKSSGDIYIPDLRKNRIVIENIKHLKKD